MDRMINTTIKDVAAKAGVSTKTVSRVINGLPYVSDKARSRVWEAANSLNYIPDEAGKQLASMKYKSNVCTGNIGCILFPTYEKYTEPDSAEILEELDKVFLKRNLHQYFCYTLTELQDPILFARMINPNKVDGCILIGLCDDHIDSIARIREKVPSVVLVGLVKDKNITCVYTDGVEGGYLAAKHLLKLGHRRIGCITGYSGHSNTELRFLGYKKALDEAGITPMVREGHFNIDGAAEATDSLLDDANPPTAIFSVSDPMAIGVYKAIQRRGLQIPGDISVAGFDDISLAKHIFPPLTTVSINKHEMVEVAVQTLMDQIDGKRGSSMRITFPVKLIVRGSTSKLDLNLHK